MKSPVIFRALFRHPSGSLNPAGFKMNIDIEVEVYCAKSGPPAEWCARRPGTKILFDVTPQSTAETLKRQLDGIHFEHRVGPWLAYDATFASKPELLQDDEWATDPKGHVYITEIRRQRVSEKAIAETNRKSLERAAQEPAAIPPPAQPKSSKLHVVKEGK